MYYLAGFVVLRYTCTETDFGWDNGLQRRLQDLQGHRGYDKLYELLYSEYDVR